VTGAAVAARAPRISITDGEVEVTAGRAFDADIPANSTAILGGYTGWDCGGSGATLNPGVSLPEWPLQADWTFGIVTRALQAADQWSGIRLVVAQYEVRGLERAVERYERQVAEAIAASG